MTTPAEKALKAEISRKIAEAIRDQNGERVFGIYAFADANDKGVMEAGLAMHRGATPNEVFVVFQSFEENPEAAYEYERGIRSALTDIAGLIVAALGLSAATADAR